MKCYACGFNDEEHNKGKQSWEKIFFLKSLVDGAFIKDNDNRDILRDVEMFACPSCGTLRVKHYVVKYLSDEPVNRIVKNNE